MLYPQDEAHAIGTDELLPDEEGLGKSLVTRLNGALSGGLTGTHPRAGPGNVAGLPGGNRQDVTDPGKHQAVQGVADHRLVVDGQQLLAHRLVDRVEEVSCSAGENNSLQRMSPLLLRPLHFPLPFLSPRRRIQRTHPRRPRARRNIGIPPLRCATDLRIIGST